MLFTRKDNIIKLVDVSIESPTRLLIEASTLI